MKNLTICVALLLGVLFSPSAPAQPTTAFVYQGVLTDEGVPASGTYDINFSAFGTETGGPFLGTVFVDDILCTNGVFAAELDFGPALDGYDDLWLRMSIRPGNSTGVFLALPGRTPMRPAPRAVRSNRTSALDVPNIVPIPGDPEGTIASAVLSSASALGGGLEFYDEYGQTTLQIRPDNSGTSAEILLTSDPSTPSFNLFLDGNNNGTGAPAIFLSGPAASMTFNTHIPGGNSVVLPDNSINSNEIFAEAGIATTEWNSGFNVGTTRMTFASTTIDCPTPGYVLVVASVEVDFSQGATESGSFLMGISEVDNALPSDAPRIVPPAYADLQSLQTWHRVFPVSAGSKTFYLVGQVTGTFNLTGVDKGQLTALYFPTAYGAVPGGLAPPVSSGNGSTAGADDVGSLRAELERLRQRLDALEER